MAHATGPRIIGTFPSAVKSPIPQQTADPLDELTDYCAHCKRAYRRDAEDHRSCGCLVCGGFGTIFHGEDEGVCECVRKHPLLCRPAPLSEQIGKLRFAWLCKDEIPDSCLFATQYQLQALALLEQAQRVAALAELFAAREAAGNF